MWVYSLSLNAADKIAAGNQTFGFSSVPKLALESTEPQTFPFVLYPLEVDKRLSALQLSPTISFLPSWFSSSCSLMDTSLDRRLGNVNKDGFARRFLSG